MIKVTFSKNGINEVDEVLKFKSFDEIFKLKNILDIIKIDCDCNQISVIPSEIGSLGKLTHFYCGGNQIEVIPSEIKYLGNLTHFSCYGNQISVIPPEIRYLVNLKYFSCNGNQIEVIPPEIGFLGNLTHFSCHSNHITELPVEIIRCRRLTSIRYQDNPIRINPIRISPLIEAFIDRMRNFRNHGIYDDTQSVHKSSIQKGTTDSIFNILKDPLMITKDLMVDELIVNTSLTCQTDLLEYISDPTLHSVLNISFSDLLLYVWNRIRVSKDFDNICLRINQEMKDSECMCFTGRLTRLVNSLISFYDDVQMPISKVEEISTIIRLIIEKHSSDPDKLLLIKSECFKELLERDYSSEDITYWVENIEL